MNFKFDLCSYCVEIIWVKGGDSIYMYIKIAHKEVAMYNYSLHNYILHLVHVELAHIKIWITSDRNEIWARDLYHSTALVEAAKSLALSNVIGHGEVPYQKPRLKSMAHAVHPRSTAYIAMYMY